jgi:nucleoside phosphorylase
LQTQENIIEAPAGVILMMGAMRQEVNSVRHALRRMEGWRAPINSALLPGARLTFFDGPARLALARGGVGPARSEAAFEVLQRSLAIHSLINFGWCGALTPGLKAGDLVVYRSLTPGTAAGPEFTSQPRLVELAVGGPAGLPVIVGRGVGVERLLAQPAEKRRLAAAAGDGELAVDMESYWLARAARRAGIPFLAVRAVSDTLDEALPDFGSLGRLLSHPAALTGLPRLAGNLRLALANLTLFWRSFIPRLVEMEAF